MSHLSKNLNKGFTIILTLLLVFQNCSPIIYAEEIIESSDTNITPIEKTHNDITLEEIPSSDVSIPEEISSSGDSVPEEISSSGDSVPEEISSSDDSVPEEILSSGDSLPEEIPSSGDSVPEEIPSSGDIQNSLSTVKLLGMNLLSLAPQDEYDDSSRRNFSDEKSETIYITDTGGNTIQTNSQKWKDMTITRGDKTFTLMDRNLGATKAATPVNGSGLYGINNTSTFGYYYQWGNNYGFPTLGSVVNRSEHYYPIDNTVGEFGPGHYFANNKFITSDPWDKAADPNLWGGESSANPDTDKQGPCPDGYHIPDQKEWNATILAFKIRLKTEEGLSFRNQYNEQSNSSYNPLSFAAALILPFPGYRSWTVGSVGNQGTEGEYRSSTPNLPRRYGLRIDRTYLSTSGGWPTEGYSLRCFKNSPVHTLSFEGNGVDIDTTYHLRRREPISSKFYITPTRKGHKFLGWYKDPEFTSQFLTSDDSSCRSEYSAYDHCNYLTEDTTLYAKWECAPGYEDIDGECIEKGFTRRTISDEKNDTIATGDNGTNQTWKDLTITWNDTSFTIMDRNLGADEMGYGYYYQWGNNYGFKNQGDLDKKSSSKVDFEIGTYGPNTDLGYYSNDTFITNSRGGWTVQNDLNLRGGSGDKNSDVDKQGPCPDGYHIPSKNERQAISNLFYSRLYSDEGNEYERDNDYQEGTAFSVALKLPLAGYRSSSNGELSSLGSYGKYWSATPYPNNTDSAYNLYTYSYSVSPSSSDYRANGLQIRCMKNDSSIHTLSFTGEGVDLPSYDLKRWEPITNIYNANDLTLNDHILGGWYTADGEKFRFSNNTYINNDTILYAKRVCEPGYEENDKGECIESQHAWKRIGNINTDVIATGANGTLQTWRDLTITWNGISFTLMDRNLGASKSGVGTCKDEYNEGLCPAKDGTYGYYYQWGNNYGFSYNSTNTGNSAVNASGYGPTDLGYFSNDKFIKDYDDRDGFGFWDSSYNKNLWGGADSANADSDKQGPCPTGYHVPDQQEWNKIKNLFYTRVETDEGQELYNDNDENMGIAFASALNLPLAGYRSNFSSMSYIGYEGMYWLANPSRDGAYSFGVYTDSLSYDSSYYRSSGLPVRCFKDSSYVLDFEGNGVEIDQNFNVRWREPVTTSFKPATPIREHSKFEGRFSDSDLQSEFKFSNNKYIDRDTTLYAKWSCDAGYSLSIDGKSCELLKVVFDANGGIFTDGAGTLVIYPEITTITGETSEYFHTNNIDDEGNSLMIGYGDDVDDTQIFSLPGAKKIHIRLRYGTESIYYDYLTLLNANDETILIDNDGNTVGSNGKLGDNEGYYYDYYEKYFIIDGDTVKFHFISDRSRDEYYGYYAFVTGSSLVQSAQYPDNAFNNIENPTREGFTFMGWDTNIETQDLSTSIMIKALWQENGKRITTPQYSGGGNRNSSITKNSHNSADNATKNIKSDVINSAESNTDAIQENNNSIENSGLTEANEMEKARKFAYDHGILGKGKSDLELGLNRITMAELLSQYAINVLGMSPNESKKIEFVDISDKLDSKHNNAVTIAYQLGIMGINMPNNRFRPYDLVPREEFVTALSRMLYQTEDGDPEHYYVPHMMKLYDKGIISHSDPDMIEHIGYVILMLMRSSK